MASQGAHPSATEAARKSADPADSCGVELPREHHRPGPQLLHVGSMDAKRAALNIPDSTSIFRMDMGFYMGSTLLTLLLESLYPCGLPEIWTAAQMNRGNQLADPRILVGSRARMKARIQGFLWVLVMGPLDSGVVCSMGPDFVDGICLVCTGVQVEGPYEVPR